MHKKPNKHNKALPSKLVLPYAKKSDQNKITGQIDEMTITIIFVRLLIFGQNLLIINPLKVDTNDAKPNDGIINIAIATTIIRTIISIMTARYYFYMVKNKGATPPRRLRNQRPQNFPPVPFFSCSKYNTLFTRIQKKY
jgi:hypothetical protein